MKKLEIVKTIGCIIVWSGVSTIVGNVIKDNTSEETGAVKKLCILAGGIVLVGMACDKAITYLNDKIDQIAEGPKVVVEEAKKEEKE